MKILMIASEMDGIVKTGGLADFTEGLPRALMALGHEVRVILPKYKLAEVPTPDSSPVPISSKESLTETKTAIVSGKKEKNKTTSLFFNLNHTTRYGCLVYHTQLNGIPVQLIEHHDFFSRDGIYDDGCHAYPDNPLRYAFLCKAALELCLQSQWIPDIIHCNDWQTALAPYYLKEHYSHRPELKNTKALLTIHNGGYQGKSDARWVDALGIHPQRFTSELMEEHGLLNLLKCGIMYADGINAVSPGYCRELLIPDTSHNLHLYLNQKKDRFRGILNGCDYTQWDPSTDSFLPHHFSVENRVGKALCKKSLQGRMGLPENSDVPLMGLIARLVAQKGFEYLIPALEKLLYENTPVQLALLGSGDPEYGSRLHHLQTRYPHKMSFVNGYDNGLSHLIEAGSDFFMMPSLFEPCGLNQLYSLAYGTLPIIRKTGGLKDTVVCLDLAQLSSTQDPEQSPNEADPTIFVDKNNAPTGIGFTHPAFQQCYEALKLAVTLYQNHHPLYLQMQHRAMGQLFTWNESARKYEKFYKTLTGT